MNFTPFGSPFTGTITGIHQFSATGSLVPSTTAHQDSTNRYNSGNVNMPHFSQPHTPILGKYRADESTSNAAMAKYNNQANQYSIPVYPQQTDQGDNNKQRVPTTSYTQTVVSNQPSELSQDLCNAILQQQNDAKRGNILQNVNTGWQSLAPSSAVADYLSHLPTNNLPLSLHHFLKYSAESIKKETQNPLTTIDMSQAQPSQGITLNMISNSNILNQPNIQQQSQHSAQHTLQPQPSHQQSQSQGTTQSQSQGTTQSQLQPNNNQQQQQAENPAPTTTKSKKKKKKKAPKEKKPRPKPGEIRIKTALDGSPLYCCPECQVAYPERGLLEQHLVGHNLERRFICDICNAALKRKDHLTRHKQSHNPERPFVCTICLKAFKRKEQLSLHFVIHSGEKRHICNECGKGFYRKDHLRKHTRSHIARRVKAELSQNNQPNTGGQTVPQTPSQQSQQSNQSNSQQMQHQQQLQSQQQQIPQPQQQHHSQIQQQQSLHLPQQTPSPQNQQSQSGAMIVQ